VTLAVPPIPVSVPVPVVRKFDWHCLEPSQHVWMLNKEIWPSDQHTSDPNPDNNDGVVPVGINCIAPADLKVTSVDVSPWPPSINVSQTFTTTILATLHNNGPWGPATGTVTFSAVAPPGCTADLYLCAFQVPLDVSVITPPFGCNVDIHCSQPSSHTFQFDAAISVPKEPHVVDPDPTNNAQVISRTVASIAQADVKITSQALVSPPSEIDVSANVPVTLHKVLHNNGPFGPVQVSISPSAVAPADCTAGPPDNSPDTYTLPVSVDTAVDEVWTIHCSKASSHTFTFNDAIAVTTPHVIDPNTANNSRSTQLAVVAIGKSDVKVTAVSVTGPAQIDVSQDVPITVRTTLHNNGPYGPVEVELAKFGVAPDDCVVGDPPGYPLGGTDEFPSVATFENILVDLDGDGLLDTSFGPGSFSGPTEVQRGNPYLLGGLETVDTEIVSMELTGLPFLGSLTIRESPTQASSGQIQEQAPGTQFPANSFFDVFVELLGTPYGPLTNDTAARVESVIHGIPPYFATYGTVDVELKDGGGITRVLLQGVRHQVWKSVQVVLPVSVDVVVEETDTIHCSQPSTHTFTFEGQIVRIKDAHVEELNPANNSASGTFTTNAIAYADMKVVGQFVENPPAEIPVSENVLVVLDKVIHNNGPYGPVDAETVTDVTAPAGCTVSPPVHVQQFLNVPVSVDILHHEPFTVHCSTLGPHTFTFDDEVDLKEPHLVELVSTNNTAQTILTVNGVAKADVKITGASFLDPPTKIPLAQNVDVTLRKHIHNNGPRGPVNIAINSTASAPTGCTIVPKNVPTSISGVPVSVDQVSDEVWTINCTLDTIPKTFVFNVSINVSTAYVSDPNLANNAVRKLLTVTDDPLDPGADTDADGWINGDEVLIGTDPLDACPDDTSDKAWPPDTDNTGSVTILDVLLYKPVLGGPYNSRYDLNTNDTVNILDVLLYKPVIGTSCSGP
jgi:hypothetical protein